MANWDQLLPDLLTIIVKKVNIYEDFVAFGGVCRSWRSVAIKENFNQQLVWSSSSPCSVQPPWLMLAEQETETDVREFVNMSKGCMSKKIALPEAKGKRCIGSMGWLITIDEGGGMDLLHPLTRVSICLPHLRTFRFCEKESLEYGIFLPFYVTRATLSASPSATGDYAVMLILGIPNKLAFWKPGNAGWTFVKTTPYPIYDVTYHKGKFYAANNIGNIYACDVGGPNPTVEMVGMLPPRSAFDEDGQIYLTEYCGDLMLVKKFINHEAEHTYWTKGFRIFKPAAHVNSTRGIFIWKEVDDLGGDSIFVGFNTPISVPSAGAVGVKPNCVYFTDDYVTGGYGGNHEKIIGGMDMGIYNLATRAVEHFHRGTASLSNYSPPIWVSPSF